MFLNLGFAELVIGFLLFGVALQFTGGGRFFLDLAFALLGKSRGGPAKVSILSSGLMGSMSGSVVTNVLTTGQLTIPAMKRAGMSGTIAGAIEARDFSTSMALKILHIQAVSNFPSKTKFSMKYWSKFASMSFVAT